MAKPGAEQGYGADARELVEWANGLARRFYQAMGYVRPEGYRFDKATHPQEVLCWQLAVIACDEYDGTDLDECVSEMEDE